MSKPTITLCQFNVENLFLRYRFDSDRPPWEGYTIDRASFSIYDEKDKTITAQAILEAKADIICVEEVENLILLDKFNKEYLEESYPYRILIDGNDQRGIDVGVLSKFPIGNVRTHRYEKEPERDEPLFSRDCLEVEIDVQGTVFTLFVNHFKSMMEGRKQSRAKRYLQASRVAQILQERYAHVDYHANFAVVGDLNDYAEESEGTTSAILPLLNNEHLEDVIKRLPSDERWTHFRNRHRHEVGNECYKQLDYILLPRALANSRANADTKPSIIRKGLPLRAKKYGGDRFDGVGMDNPCGSDHCPVVFKLTLL